jgi:hypothetical protein
MKIWDRLIHLGERFHGEHEYNPKTFEKPIYAVFEVALKR